jgi:hypothetical protein
MRSEVSTIAQLAHRMRTPKKGSAEEKATQVTFDRREGNSLLMYVLPFFLFNFDREYEDGLWTNWYANSPSILFPYSDMFGVFKCLGSSETLKNTPELQNPSQSGNTDSANLQATNPGAREMDFDKSCKGSASKLVEVCEL